MNEKKYVIKNGSAIIFSSAINHSDFGGGIEGAGFVSIYSELGSDDVDCVCYGESISLGIKSRGEEDAWIIKSQLF
jgi:hypothetical protein